MDISSLRLFSSKEAAQSLDIGVARFNRLVKKYQIPHQLLSCGKIFLQEDIKAFQKSRQDKMKHAGKKTK